MILNTMLTAKQTLDAAKDKLDAAKDKLEETKDKIAKYNLKKIRGLVIAFFVINLIISVAALAVGIWALLKARRNTEYDFDDYDDYDYLDFEDEDDDFENFSAAEEKSKADADNLSADELDNEELSF